MIGKHDQQIANKEIVKQRKKKTEKIKHKQVKQKKKKEVQPNKKKEEGAIKRTSLEPYRAMLAEMSLREERFDYDPSITMKEYPAEERPMEKLASRGVHNLSEEELLAILIGSGTKEKNALELADYILRRRVHRPWLLKASLGDLMEVPGIGLAKASRIMAGLHLGKRLTEQKNFQAISLSDPQTVADYFSAVYISEDREIFCCVLLDTKNRPLSNEIISIGTLNSTLVHPREVFRPAIREGANAVLLSHNHPSGEPEPSREDIAITLRLVEAGKIIGIPVLDHVIVGDKKYVSLKQEDLM